MDRELAFPISQSSLKNLLVHPNFYKFKKESKNREYKTAFSMGGAVDSMLISEEEFNKRYIVQDVKYPTGKGLIMLNHMLNNLQGVYEEELAEAFKKASYAASTKYEAVKSKFETQYTEILDVYRTGKIIITLEQHTKILAIVYSFKTSKFTKGYFDNKKYTIIDQLRIEFTFHGKLCVGILDRVLIDKKSKTIRVIDWKTSAGNFEHSISKFGYDFQGAFYHLAIRAWADANKLSKYILLPYQLIVESTKYPGTPLVYELTGEKIMKNIKKIENTINDLMWHLDNNKWDYTKEVYENNGIITIDDV
tara:strand:- start:9592 stop:10512 length:921 start_codon:yes stop_codon:yes gene_type:complete